MVPDKRPHTPHVVVLGAGFGGLNAIRALRNAPVEITVVDQRNHHLFQPLLYQVATSVLSPGDIAYPIRAILKKQSNARVLLGRAEAVDLPARQVRLADGEALSYDYLVIATGASHAYFGHDEWERWAPGLKTLEDALEIRRRILLAFEHAEREPDAARRAAWLTFVVVGGGPTGVELAGAIAEIARDVMVHDFRHIDPRESRVLLVEAAPHLLTAFPPDLSAYSAGALKRMGVEVLTGTMVTCVDARGVELRSPGPAGELTQQVRIDADTVLWAAGVAASSLARTLAVELDRVGRVPVSPELTVAGHPEVFVIGDLAHLEWNGKPLPGVAPVAIQQGRHVAANIRRALAGRPYSAFHYFDKGSLAAIGKLKAVGFRHRAHLRGLFAWLVWAVVHIMYLVGFRNRIAVALQWSWSFLTEQRAARLITGNIDQMRQPSEEVIARR